MAFRTAAGYGNLPNGVFSPVIYSKKVQLAFRRKTVVGDITNSDYWGEIANEGDTVRVIKEPEIEVHEYARGTSVKAQDLVDEDFTLSIDKAHYFSFKVNEIEQKHSHVGWMDIAADKAAYNLKDRFDREVLAYMSGFKYTDDGSGINGSWSVNSEVNGTKAISSAGSDELLASMKLSRPSFGNFATPGSVGDSIPVAARLPGATDLPDTYVSPVMLINRMRTLLDRQYVPEDGRWVVVDPWFCEVLADEDSRFNNADFGPSGSLRSGNMPMQISGFRVYRSNNTPSIGTGPGTNGTGAQSSNYGVIVAGHDASCATAEQINKTERLRDQDDFADKVRGLHLYGRKILRPEALVVARYNLA